MNFINQYQPLIESEEILSVESYLRSGGWLTEFKRTAEFASLFSDFTGAKFSFIMPNGTLSLTAALSACGLVPGDEVLVPDLTMVASASAALLLGCTVKFVDINSDSLCMDFDKMKAAVGPRTKAVVLVSLNGRYPDNIQAYVEFCKARKIWLVEDSAQALGSLKLGRQIGTFGDIGSFSFSSPKIITTGQGGALITNDPVLAERISKLRDFGRERPGADRYLTVGWNYKFTDLQACIGIEQLKKIDKRIARKKELGKLYDLGLAEVRQINLIKTEYSETTPWFFDALVSDRDRLKLYLESNGIGSREFYPPLHSEEAFGLDHLSYPVASDIAARGLWLPSSLSLTDEEVHYVCGVVKKFYS